MKIPAAQHYIHLEELARLIAKGLSDKDIIQQMHLSPRTYYYRKNQVSRIYGNLAERKTEAILEGEVAILKERFLRLYRQLEQSVTNGNDRLKDKAIAAHTACEIATDIFRLEFEAFTSREARAKLKEHEQQAARHI